MSGPLKITRVSGRALPLRGHDIDTDRIIPARFLVAVSFEGLEKHVFEDDRKDGGHPFDAPQYQGARVLFVNRNFGCGSSREHAPQAIRRKGFRAVVGESFSEIFFGNSVALGMPCVSGSPADVARLQAVIEDTPGVEIAIDIESQQLQCGDWRMAISLPPAARESFVDGTWDATGLLLDRFEEVEATLARLPYVNGWRS